MGEAEGARRLFVAGALVETLLLKPLLKLFAAGDGDVHLDLHGTYWGGVRGSTVTREGGRGTLLT